jgi:E3 ubiquitin-protein ligase HUWE1
VLISVPAFITNEDAALTTVFLYEPDLVAKIAELLKSPSNVDSRIQAAAAYALDACAHHRSKLSEVLSGLSANLNHGIFFSALRHMSDSLMKDSGGECNWLGYR